jgi:hypothetical protein
MPVKKFLKKTTLGRPNSVLTNKAETLNIFPIVNMGENVISPDLAEANRYV